MRILAIFAAFLLASCGSNRSSSDSTPPPSGPSPLLLDTVLVNSTHPFGRKLETSWIMDYGVVLATLRCDSTLCTKLEMASGSFQAKRVGLYSALISDKQALRGARLASLSIKIEKGSLDRSSWPKRWFTVGDSTGYFESFTLDTNQSRPYYGEAFSNWVDSISLKLDANPLWSDSLAIEVHGDSIWILLASKKEANNWLGRNPQIIFETSKPRKDDDAGFFEIERRDTLPAACLAKILSGGRCSILAQGDSLRGAILSGSPQGPPQSSLLDSTTRFELCSEWVRGTRATSTWTNWLNKIRQPFARVRHHWFS